VRGGYVSRIIVRGLTLIFDFCVFIGDSIKNIITYRSLVYREIGSRPIATTRKLAPDGKMTDSAEELIMARDYATRFAASLPTSVDVAALGVKSKAPWQLLCTREALMWRTEELARNACDALERADFSVAALLARAIMENAALAWKLMQVLERHGSQSAQELNDVLMRMLVGSKKWDDMPQAINILTCLQGMNKKIPGVLAAYDSLSEMAHPNWRGVFGLYAETDRANYISYFGRALGDKPAHATGTILDSMLGSLGAFEYAYNRISEMMPGFLAELEGIWSDEDDSASG